MVALVRIIVADSIMSGNLFAGEEGYDITQSADNLADLKGRLIVDYLEQQYPGVEVYADIAIHKENTAPGPVEVMAYVSEEMMDPAESAAIQKQLSRLLAEGTADRSWAVRIA